MGITCKGGDVVTNASRDALLEVSPTFVHGEIHTCRYPIGILHITIDTCHHGRLLEVRSIGGIVVTVDKHVVVTMQRREALSIVAHYITRQRVNLDRYRQCACINEIAVFCLGKQVAIPIRAHA